MYAFHMLHGDQMMQSYYSCEYQSDIMNSSLANPLKKTSITGTSVLDTSEGDD